jgi:hypothetical protein
MSTPILHADFDDLARQMAGRPTKAEAIYGCRREIKLVVTPDLAAAIRAAVAERLPVEQWVPGRRRTLIHSIYFDSPDFDLYRRSIDSDSDLSLKLRLRSYADAVSDGLPDPARFLEAKMGSTATSGVRLKQKARMVLADEQWAAFLQGGQPVADLNPTSRKRFWRPLLGFMATHEVGARLTVSYVREAFVDPDGQLRVTFDEDYRASPIDPGAVSPLQSRQGRIGDVRIVEIKFLDTMPSWLAIELVRLGLSPDGQPFSKFKTAVPLLFPHHAR